MRPLSEWAMGARNQLVGVFTDIDDTLTTNGAITPDALRALADLKAAGLLVIPITGRPIGWCEQFATPTSESAWPVDAILAENGAVAFDCRRNQNSSPNLRSKLSKLYQQDIATRADNRLRMQQIAARVTREVPGVFVSRDSAGRETDLAFDHGEYARLAPEAIQQVLAILQGEGMHTTVSSIHIHGCFGDFNKWNGACWITRTLLGRELESESDRWVFVGDSGNDQAMFQRIKHSVGVANIAHFVPQLNFLPRYITTAERGAGFAEVATAILAAHAE